MTIKLPSAEFLGGGEMGDMTMSPPPAQCQGESNRFDYNEHTCF